jgi:Meiotic cell cortex C-terminal pleckstrin homology
VTIQSVLDVKDDTPLPKGATAQAHFNRSILILTPQRALKFTALTLERHYVWLTALSFLSHSSLGANDLAALPPVPKEGFVSPPPTATLRRNPIRDSIRVAKGKPRPKPVEQRSFASHPVPVPELPGMGMDLIDPIMDAADPPHVPRFSSHSRKRSNTAPRPPPSAFRSFSNHAPMPSTYSATTASSEIYSPTSVGGPGFGSSRRTSEASGPSSVGTGNFFDAVGTIRMEAFIDHTHVPRPRGYRLRQGMRKRDSNHWGAGHNDLDFTRFEDGSEAFYRHEDPFREF